MSMFYTGATVVGTGPHLDWSVSMTLGAETYVAPYSIYGCPKS